MRSSTALIVLTTVLVVIAAIITPSLVAVGQSSDDDCVWDCITRAGCHLTNTAPCWVGCTAAFGCTGPSSQFIYDPGGIGNIQSKDDTTGGTDVVTFQGDVVCRREWTCGTTFSAIFTACSTGALPCQPGGLNCNWCGFTGGPFDVTVQHFTCDPCPS